MVILSFFTNDKENAKHIHFFQMYYQMVWNFLFNSYLSNSFLMLFNICPFFQVFKLQLLVVFKNVILMHTLFLIHERYIFLLFRTHVSRL